MSLLMASLLVFLLSINSVGQQASTGLASGFGSLFLIGEQSDVMISPSGLNLHEPFSGATTPANPTIGRGGYPSAGNILTVTSLRNGPQIRASVVQPITVDMIALDGVVIGRQAQQGTMQQSPLPMPVDALFSHGVPVIVKVPAPLSDPLNIYGVDQGVGAQFAPMRLEWNQRGQAVSTQFDGMRSHVAASGSAQHRAVVLASDSMRLEDDLDAATITGERQGSARTQEPAASIRGVAGTGAQEALARVDRANTGEEVGLALTADARNGTLRLHLDLSPSNRGAVSPAVSAARGLCVASIVPVSRGVN